MMQNLYNTIPTSEFQREFNTSIAAVVYPERSVTHANTMRPEM
jgi:hypothetical protein